MITTGLSDDPPPAPGQLIARGAARHLAQAHDMAVIAEFAPARGLRVDLAALSPRGEIWVVECKSCRADFTADRKWQGYLDWCDRFFWAVGPDFPRALLPADTGLILADAYGGELVAMAPRTPLAPARRKALTLSFARCAAQRVQALRDPVG